MLIQQVTLRKRMRPCETTPQCAFEILRRLVSIYLSCFLHKALEKTFTFSDYPDDIRLVPKYRIS